MTINEIEGAIEAILFVSGQPVSLAEISNALDIDDVTVKKIIHSLSNKYLEKKRGIQITEINNTFQMCTNPQYFSYIADQYKAAAKKQLTQPCLETLAIIAYRQPVTKADIEKIRGVNADHAVNKLMEYNLICERGRKDSPGKPILFGTSDDFLRYFGFKNLKELPLLSDNLDEFQKEAMAEIK